MAKTMDTGSCVHWFWNILLVHFTCTSKFSTNCNGDVCSSYSSFLSGKTRTNFSWQESLLILKSSKNPFENIWPVATSISYDLFLTKSLCSNLTEFYTSMFFWKSVFWTKWILAIITLKRQICQISTICTLFWLHDLIYYFSFNKVANNYLTLLMSKHFYDIEI